MADKTLKDLAKEMKGIDICFLSTHGADGDVRTRPMSNNGEVDYDGESHFFALDTTFTVQDVSNDSRVALGFTGKHWKFIAVQGTATLSKDKQAFKDHWSKDLDLWFQEGIDTEGLTLIRVKAQRIHWWDKASEGELVL